MAKQMAGHVDSSATAVDQFNAVQDESNQTIDHRFAQMTPMPLEEIPLRAEEFRFAVERVVAHYRDLTAMRCFEETRDLLKLHASCTDVVFQPEVVVFSTLGKQALLDDDVGDEFLRHWITFRCSVRALDDVNAHRRDEAVST
jgi:hypothetical protein